MMSQIEEIEQRLTEALHLVREQSSDEYSLLRAANHARLSAELLVEYRLTKFRQQP